MFGQNFQRKYALTDQGVRNTKKGTFWTFLVNLIVMGGMGILYLLMYKLMDTLTEGRPLPSAPPLLVLVVLFVLLSFLTHLQQYKATYGLVYNEVKATRLSLAERLRKLPLGYFGKRDLADLTETLMGDVNRMEHVWSHVLGYLYGSYLSTALIAVCLLVYDWQLAIACLWGVPVAFGLLFGTRRLSARSSERTKKAAVRVSDGIQEALENVREIRATNQEARYLAGLNQRRSPSRASWAPASLSTPPVSSCAWAWPPPSWWAPTGFSPARLTSCCSSCSCWSSPGSMPPSTRAWPSSRSCSSPRCPPTA